MAIYEIQATGIQDIHETSFSQAGLRERADLQRLLRDRIDVIAPDTLVIAEEFGQWEDSRRRIDLLGIDDQANLVVIELKRTDDGGHMELQAIRYAAMVSQMTFDRAVDLLAHHLKALGSDEDARQTLLNHLGWDEPDEDMFAQDARIVLAAADFSKEITTSVLWLNERGLDIRCVRIKPYTDGQRVLVDVQQLIPLPEAEDYQVRMREKQQQERKARRGVRERFDITVGEDHFPAMERKYAMLKVVQGLCAAGVSPEQIAEVVDWRKHLFACCPGALDSEAFHAQMPARAQSEGWKFSEARYFTDDDGLIRVNGSTYALLNRWGPRTGTALRRLTERFPDRGVSFRRLGPADLE